VPTLEDRDAHLVAAEPTPRHAQHVQRVDVASQERFLPARSEETSPQLLKQPLTVIQIHAPAVPELLALDARGGGALLHEAGVVEDQDTVRLSEAFGDVALEFVTDVVRVSAGTGEQVLQSVGGGVACVFGQLPAVLAGDAGRGCIRSRGGPCKTAPDALPAHYTHHASL
jgi:hypothetical protein